MSIEGIFIAIIVLLILAFGCYILFHKKKRFSARKMKEIKEHWREIESLQEEHPEQSILKADKLLDHALKQAGYSGTLGEKMKAARAVFSDNNGLWSAHKLRNRIAHEMNVKISSLQSKGALKAFRKALRDLGVAL